jgi:putative transposase
VTRQVQVSASAVYGLGYHVVWCPKYRCPAFAGRVAARCGELIRAKASEHGWRIVALEIMPDHMHPFVKAHPSGSPSRVANQFKGFTSRCLRGRVPASAVPPANVVVPVLFRGHGAVSAETVRRYIDTQNERPRRKERAR